MIEVRLKQAMCAFQQQESLLPSIASNAQMNQKRSRREHVDGRTLKTLANSPMASSRRNRPTMVCLHRHVSSKLLPEPSIGASP